MNKMANDKNWFAVFFFLRRGTQSATRKITGTAACNVERALEFVLTSEYNRIFQNTVLSKP